MRQQPLDALDMQKRLIAQQIFQSAVFQQALALNAAAQEEQQCANLMLAAATPPKQPPVAEDEFIDWDALLGDDISPDAVKNATSDDLQALFPELMCSPLLNDEDEIPAVPLTDEAMGITDPIRQDPFPQVVVQEKFPQSFFPRTAAAPQLLTPPLSDRSFSPTLSVPSFSPRTNSGIKVDPPSASPSVKSAIPTYLPTPGTPSMNVAPAPVSWGTAQQMDAGLARGMGVGQDMLAMAMFPPMMEEQGTLVGKTGVARVPAVVQPNDSAQSQAQEHESKRRRRGQEDEEDVPEELRIKRLKNTEAARRSRQRKAELLESLERRAAELEASNAALLAECERFEEDRRRWEEEERKYAERITWLQNRLNAAHEAIQIHGGASGAIPLGTSSV
ncbi:hypothetical protein HDU93_002187 [Gonapodya sp. JEL0774]|nr:hypothetical protein HDU93_002187 [Gonapodya sp. JEL0774]